MCEGADFHQFRKGLPSYARVLINFGAWFCEGDGGTPPFSQRRDNSSFGLLLAADDGDGLRQERASALFWPGRLTSRSPSRLLIVAEPSSNCAMLGILPAAARRIFDVHDMSNCASGSESSSRPNNADCTVARGPSSTLTWPLVRLDSTLLSSHS
jgi:hypothetical protein